MQIKIFDIQTYKSLGSLKDYYLKSCFPINSVFKIKKKHDDSTDVEMIIIGTSITYKNEPVIIVKLLKSGTIFRFRPDEIVLSKSWIRNEKLNELFKDDR
jgi:hypothetical protein